MGAYRSELADEIGFDSESTQELKEDMWAQLENEMTVPNSFYYQW